MSKSLEVLAQQYLFADEKTMEGAKVPEATRARLYRLREGYSYWLRYPNVSGGELVELLCDKYGICRSAAYEDVKVIKWCIGAMNQHSVDFERWLFVQRTDLAWEKALAEEDLKAMSSILATRAKYMRLDREESSAPDYSTITPPFLEITGDVSVAGFEPIPNVEERAKKLLRRYIKDEAEDAEYTDVEGGDDVEKQEKS